ncbi:MAG: DTW domain-containing protein [Chlamydiae bacterium]|nr:DTW domain-containing protein [Chlamydiota bacterium]
MSLFLPTIIFRHRKENLKKCSLRGLEERKDLIFYSYPLSAAYPDLSQYLLLALDGPQLSAKDQDKGLLILDATWKKTEKMMSTILGYSQLEQRSIPTGFKTAYPRRQEDCPDPVRGLASIEALFIAYTILERDRDGLLDHYYFAADFLKKNNIVKT